MKIAKIIGLIILLGVWIWLSWAIFASNGINLKNILIVGMSAIIIFVPLYKKYFASSSKDD